MRFSLRTLHATVLVAFLILLSSVLPYSWSLWARRSALDLTIVAFLGALVYGRGAWRAFSVGGLAAILLPWMRSSRGDWPPLVDVIRSTLSVGGSGLVVQLIWLVTNAGWIALCGGITLWIARRFDRLPVPPPVDNPTVRREED